MLAAVRLGHEQRDVAADQRLRRVAEQRFDGRIDAFHGALRVDDDDGILHVVADRLQAAALQLDALVQLERAQGGAQLGFQDDGQHRLDEVVVAAGFQPEQEVGLPAEHGEVDHRHPAVAAARLDAARRLEAVDAGQQDVHQHQVGLRRLENRHRLQPVVGEDRLLADGFEHAGQRLCQHGVILDDEYRVARQWVHRFSLAADSWRRLYSLLRQMKTTSASFPAPHPHPASVTRLRPACLLA